MSMAEQVSERELEVAKLIAYGHTNKQCALKLELSVKTVETHKSNVMAKLGISSRVDLVHSNMGMVVRVVTWH